LIRNEPPVNVSDLFNGNGIRNKIKVKHGFGYAPTFRSNGTDSAIQIFWQKYIKLTKKFTEEEFAKKQKNQEKYKKKKAKKIKEQIAPKEKQERLICGQQENNIPK